MLRNIFETFEKADAFSWTWYENHATTGNPHFCDFNFLPSI